MLVTRTVATMKLNSWWLRLAKEKLSLEETPLLMSWIRKKSSTQILVHTSHIRRCLETTMNSSIFSLYFGKRPVSRKCPVRKVHTSFYSSKVGGEIFSFKRSNFTAYRLTRSCRSMSAKPGGRCFLQQRTFMARRLETENSQNTENFTYIL